MTPTTKSTEAPFIEIEVGWQQLRCEYDYSPGSPDVHTLPNGDPGYPGDPEEFTVNRVTIFVGPTPVNPEAWLDITDLIEEVSGGTINGSVLEDKAFNALQAELEEARESDEAARYEALENDGSAI